MYGSELPSQGSSSDRATVAAATNPAATFYEVGDTWTEDTPTFTQVTASLKIMGGDADIDRFLQQTYSDPNDLDVEIIKGRAKAVAHLYGERY